MATAGPPVPDEYGPVEALPLWRRPVVWSGVYAWSLLGFAGTAFILLLVLQRVSLVVIPLVLALFPAALLSPLAARLKRAGLPDAAAALLVLLLFVAVFAGVVGYLVPTVSAEVESISSQVRQGIDELRAFLSGGPFGLENLNLDDLVAQARDQIAQAEGVGSSALSAVAQVGRFLTGLVLLLFALFFYLKDGPRLAGWLRSLAPERRRDDVAEVGRRAWTAIGAYFQGQLLVALFDAVFIAIALVILDVQLAVPLGILVFFGGLFPIVGALLSGSVAVLVALATNGFLTAVWVLAAIIAVQQIEGNLLQPIILGRATQLHPLAVIVSLTIGGTLLGVLGAFLAVPVAAAANRTAGYIRAQIPD